jgi:hypothetical protein
MADPKSASDLKDEFTKILNAAGFERGNFDRSSGLARQSKLVIDGIIASPKLTLELYDEVQEKLEADAKGMAQYYDAIHQTFGGLHDLTDETIGKASKTVLAATDRFELMKDAYSNTAKFKETIIAATASGDRLASLDFSYLSQEFDSLADAANAQSEVMNQLIMQHSQYANTLDKTTQLKIPAYASAMHISTTTVAELMERSLVETGKFSTDILDNIVRYSSEISKQTGLPMQQLEQQTAKVLTNIEKFGYTTEKEASRISATLMQLGMKFDSFMQVQQKFQEFGSAATVSGNISQLTGGQVQLDAAEMMYLANEEIEKLVPTLRKRYLEAGFDKEQFMAMTKMDQTALAAEHSLQANEFAEMISRERETFTQEDLLGMQKTADTKTEAEVYAEVTEQLSKTKGAYRKEAETAEKARERAMAKWSRDMYTLTTKNAEFQTELARGVKIPGVEFPDNAMKPFIKGTELMLEQVKKLEQPINMDGAAAGFSSAMKAIASGAAVEGDAIVNAITKGTDGDGLGIFLPRSIPVVWQRVLKGMTNFEKAAVPQLTKTGLSLSNALKSGMIKSGIDFDDIENIKNVVTDISNLNPAPQKIQSNISAILDIIQKLETLKESDKSSVSTNLEKFTEKINTLLIAVTDNQSSIAELLNKDSNVNLVVDAVEIGKAVLSRAHAIETVHGLKLGVSIR